MDKKLQDLVWSCLPKEFKEKVKYEYSRVATKVIKTNYDLGFMNAHEGMYGIHNLTSDAEGDEMLTVEKSKVMKLYNKFQKDGTFTCLYAVGVLDTLFGSKCLPDEKIDPERMVNTIKESIEHPVPDKMLLDGIGEQKAAEPLSQNSPENCDNGNHISNDCDKSAEPNVKSLSAWQDEDDPDLAQRLAFLNSLSNEQSEPKYHKGDKVLYKGKLKVVMSEMFPNRYYSIALPNGQSPFCRHESDLEPYAEPKENVNHRHIIANCDKQFDNILKDSFSKERRQSIAVQLTCSMIPKYQDNGDGHGLSVLNEKDMIKCAYRLADMLIAEAEKGGNDGDD